MEVRSATRCLPLDVPPVPADVPPVPASALRSIQKNSELPQGRRLVICGSIGPWRGSSKGASMNVLSDLSLVSILILILAIAAGPGLVWMFERWIGTTGPLANQE